MKINIKKYDGIEMVEIEAEEIIVPNNPTSYRYFIHESIRKPISNIVYVITEYSTGNVFMESGKFNKFADRDVKNNKADLIKAFLEGLQKNYTYINKTVPLVIETYGYANK